jgi:UV excision repair protein RAD23
MKLIHKGRILEDQKSVSECEITQFLVVLELLPSKVPGGGGFGAETNTVAAPAAAPLPTIKSDESPAPTPANTMMPQLADLIEMGFDRAEAEQALAAAFNDSARAVEYLTSGIPPEILEAQQAELGQLPTESEYSAFPTFQQTDSAFGRHIRDTPALRELRHAIQTDPQNMVPTLNAIAQEDPNLVQLITQNREEFMNWIRSRSDDEMNPLSQGEESEVSAWDTGLTPDDLESLVHLQELGFSRSSALQAFMMCNKNRELAANLLVEGLFTENERSEEEDED